MRTNPNRGRTTRSRPGFTLVEMLVAMALTMFVMVILSDAFVTSLDTFGQLKAIGDMEDSLRTAAINIRDDLRQQHFGTARKLSERDFWANRPSDGFFAIYQQPHTDEGADGEGIGSFRATNHELHFSVKLSGARRENYMWARVNPANDSPFFPGGANYANTSGDPTDPPPDQFFRESYAVYNSRWGEVHYKLVPTGSVAEPNNPASTQTPTLHALVRSQYAVVPDNSQLNTKNESEAYLRTPPYYYHNMSCFPVPQQTGGAKLYFNSPADLTQANRRVGRRADTDTTYRTDVGRERSPEGRRGGTLLLSNVLSFSVRILTETPPNSGVWDWQFLPTATPWLDTGHPSSPTPVIRAIEITLRVWDMKTQQTRQATIVEPM